MLMSIRRATKNDLRFFYELRNEKVARSLFSSNKIIMFDEHTRWLYSSLESSQARIFVVLFNDERAATVRETVYSDRRVISLVISEEFRGLGLCKEILGMYLAALDKDYRPIDAFILERNKKSIRCFRSAGFIGTRLNRGTIRLSKNSPGFR